ncbi:unnamed protein product [Rotaria magnacalcarata]|uniref:ERCC1-like central domain-containing protein n=1 Tax=Rotaria magnacalcarata TaxID=392030 RepID=A0A815S4M1_9BILA|nr:unnamed protein product [Rotaria magnacalcarata]CAF2236977.1 unnamed protein product [Rotaria magnacalcarata]
MATHSYVIRDLDDDDDNDDNSNQRESLNLFSKRMKIDDLSKNNDTHSYESNPSNPIPETDSSTSSIRPSPSIPSSSSLLVHSRQRGNPLLKHIRQVKWEYSDMILGGADYSMSRSSCALYLSLRYHQLNQKLYL